MLNLHFLRSRPIVICLSSFITTAIFITAGFLFVVLALTNSSYDSVRIEFNHYEKQCLCKADIIFRGKKRKITFRKTLFSNPVQI